MRFARALVVAASVLVLTSVAGCAPEQSPVSEKVAAYYAKNSTLAPRTEPAKLRIPADLLVEGSKLAFYGDSWTGGAGATAMSRRRFASGTAGLSASAAPGI
jgi:hypothetical protein